MPHELFLTTRQKTKIVSTFTNIMSTDIKLSKEQLKKLIESGGCLGNMINNLGQKPLLNFAATLAKDVMPKLPTKTTLPASDKL